MSTVPVKTVTRRGVPSVAVDLVLEHRLGCRRNDLHLPDATTDAHPRTAPGRASQPLECRE